MAHGPAHPEAGRRQPSAGVRVDLAPDGPERLDLAFLAYAWNSNRTQRARGLALVEGFPGRRLIMTGRDAEAGLDALP